MRTPATVGVVDSRTATLLALWLFERTTRDVLLGRLFVAIALCNV